VLSQPTACLPANGRAYDLYCRHEWQRQEHGPAKAIAELGASLGIGRNAAGIIVGRPGDEAWAKQAHKTACGVRTSPFSSASHVLFPATPRIELYSSPTAPTEQSLIGPS
jgi:hypothetical protein